MKRLHKLFSLLTFALVACQSITAQGKQHTSVRLVMDVQSVQPGSTFTAGLVLTMDDGWHTYWKNPGESGLPTSVSWTLPPGVTAGEILWPVPEKQIEEGDILAYGYTGETMLMVPVSVPANAAPGTHMILKAAVNWLECEKLCVPGSATAELTVPIRAEQPVPNNVALFARYRSKLPRPVSTVQDVQVTTQLRDRAVELLLRAPGRSLVTQGKDAPDFYPEPVDPLLAGRASVTASAQEAKITQPLAAGQPIQGDHVLRGVLIYRPEGGERTALQVEVPLPGSFLATLSAASNPPDPGTAGVLERTFETTQSGEGALSLAAALLLAFVGGLLLNIMPCVLPVIALKIFGLVRMAGDHPRQVRTLGGFFSLGILASFLILALLVIILKAAGEQVGWGFQFQEPMFVIAMSAVVFAFGLSLFGVYEIRLPSKAVSGVGGLLAKQEGVGKAKSASFSEGVFATILATPCTAPYLGAALGFAFAQPAWVVLLIFAVVAFGMSLPYLLLTARPAWLKFLPKPGAWMETAKQFMGFLMMATLLWLLYILGKQLGMEAVIWTGAFLLTVALAFWLVGRYATLSASRRTVALTWIAALVIAVGGYFLFIESILNVRSVIAGVPSVAAEQHTSEQGGIPWKPFSLTGLEADLQSGKPVFIDFSAEWCLTCKVNERTVLADKDVVEKLRSSGVITIKADWTNRNPDITRLLAKFGRSGVPLYVVFPAGEPTRPIVLPEVITSGIVIGAIEKAL